MNFGIDLKLTRLGMQIWVLILLVYAKNAECVSSNSNEKLRFAPLPEGKPYSLNKEEGKWSLNGLTNIANGIALTLREHPPYGKIFIYFLFN